MTLDSWLQEYGVFGLALVISIVMSTTAITLIWMHIKECERAKVSRSKELELDRIDRAKDNEILNNVRADIGELKGLLTTMVETGRAERYRIFEELSKNKTSIAILERVQSDGESITQAIDKLGKGMIEVIKGQGEKR